MNTQMTLGCIRGEEFTEQKIVEVYEEEISRRTYHFTL